MGDHVLFKERVAQWISEYPEMIPPVCSNRESGQGRYDILLKPKAGKPEWKRDDLYGVVIEIKKGLDKLDQAMEPIQQKEYAQKLKAEGCERIMATAIGVEGKQVELKTAILESS